MVAHDEHVRRGRPARGGTNSRRGGGGHPSRHSQKPGRPDALDLQEATAGPSGSGTTLDANDPLALLAAGHWGYLAPNAATLRWKPKIVDVIYQDHLGRATSSSSSSAATAAVTFLEQSQYLERYLWPHYPTAGDVAPAHTLSVVQIINEKFRQRVTDPWAFLSPASEGSSSATAAEGSGTTVDPTPGRLSHFFSQIVQLLSPPRWADQDTKRRSVLLGFLVYAFQSLENPAVRLECMRLVSVAMWHHVEPKARDAEFSAAPTLKKVWRHLAKKYAQAPPERQEQLALDRSVIAHLMDDFLARLAPAAAVPDSEAVSAPALISLSDTDRAYAERFLEFLIDLEAQLPTRRYVHLLLQDRQVITYSRRSAAYADTTAATVAFRRLVDMLEFYLDFDIDNHTGVPLNEAERTRRHYERVGHLQLLAFRDYREELRDLTLASVASIETEGSLRTHLAQLSRAQLLMLCRELGVRTTRPAAPCTAPTAMDTDAGPDTEADTAHLLDVLAQRFARRQGQRDLVAALPLYPAEDLLFDPSAGETARPHARVTLADLTVPPLASASNSTSSVGVVDRPHCLPLPKLNLQFLTLQDYLLRNFTLFRLEAAYEIRSDLEDAVRRLGPHRVTESVGNDHHAGNAAQSTISTQFSGWSRMAAPLETVTVVEVAKPRLGSRVPARVRADVTFYVGRYTDSVRRDWDDQVRPHSVLFLLTVAAPAHAHRKFDRVADDFRAHYGVRYVRGCQVSEVLGEDGQPLPLGALPTGPRRTYRVLLDPHQYAQDLADYQARDRDHHHHPGRAAEDVYETFNVLLRRKPEENNFKAVLETIRDLTVSCSDLTVPTWLRSVFLGYGDPASAHYRRLATGPTRLDFRDTFLDLDHLRASFPDFQVQVDEERVVRPPFVVSFPAVDAPDRDTLTVSTYTVPNAGPYPRDIPRHNAVRFTPRQTEAIRAGLNPGLTLIVGPPGTGKTDVAVQIIANLYHNFPEQRILLVTHSNQALNQLFAKIMALDIAERHLLRLGHGEEDLETEESFSKLGRVNSFLERRLRLLAEVDRLARSLDVPGDHGDTCETAGYFYISGVLPRWEPYLARLRAAKSIAGRTDPDNQVRTALIEEFPFHKYFVDAPQPLFPADASMGTLVDTAEGCFRHLRAVFTELEEIRAFELLRSNRDRSDYLLTKEARIVALTCTHAALNRREFVRLGFHYDTVIMEEAAQVLEVETFIPLVLQDPTADASTSDRERLRRVVLIGDHHQLPPIVRNQRFQKYGNLEQSLFARFIRLGVPHVQLDRQGRARPPLAALYAWRYRALGHLPNVMPEGGNPSYGLANPGLAYPLQLINVDDFRGRGESTPAPYFYQNLGEAEYVVAVYQYMRLRGYPADRITILTTYNGQRALINDVLTARCAWNQAFFSRPARITTVDKYQGQQNDYILLSLVRTNAVGHLRDVRRLTVAVSRARLGLYVFARAHVFRACAELAPTFAAMDHYTKDHRLALVPGETYPTERPVDQEVPTMADGQNHEGDGLVRVSDVTAMGELVYRMAQVQLQSAAPAPVADDGAEEEGVMDAVMEGVSEASSSEATDEEEDKEDEDTEGEDHNDDSDESDENEST
ncbi:hypothetical protein IWQ60_005960 [Tieghemiomyces parasiticus]|uniref:Pre-mRNA-splicing factor n=1 Tax=Tieghemiomyces parasiticus TaxID=78921 RepID=A0A9W8A5E0_9FUNG|nr:hypothetical protein IWQ60_005960 [Tieghemiomyces parasiticus]